MSFRSWRSRDAGRRKPAPAFHGPSLFAFADARAFAVVVTVALSLASFVDPLGVAAQPAPTDALTLREAVEAAVARQPETASSPQRRQAAEAQSRVARSWTPEPMALEASVKTDQLNSKQGEREWVAGIAAPLWLPGQRDGTMALADAEQRAVDVALRAAQWRVAATVRDAWWALHLARNDLQAAQARLTHADQLARDVNQRVRAGDLARADQHQADGMAAAATSELATARAAQVRAVQALRALTDVPASRPLSTAAEAMPSIAPAQALAEHPALRELEAKADIARRAGALAATQTRANPELTLATTRERGAFGEAYVQSITVGVRIPFGSSDRHAARIASASADQTEAEIRLARERERLDGDISAAQERLAAAGTALEAADRRAMLARETREFHAKSFRLGETDLPSRLRIDLEAFEAERQQARAQVERARAVSDLRQSLGLPPQ